MVERYHRSYPGVRENYHAMIQNALKTTRTLINPFGRSRLFLGPVIPIPPNITASHCHQTYKEGYAHIPQSTTADKINEQGVEFIYYNDNPLFHPTELLAQIHDSVVFQLPLSLPWTWHADILLKIKHSLETPINWNDLSINTPVDLAIGFNMCKEEMKELKSKDFPNTTNALAERLEAIYGSLREKAA
jgi:hypothetical protein